MPRKIGEMLSGLEIPQLTDYSAANYKGVMDATMQGYESAMKAVNAKVATDQANYSREVRDAQQRAANRAAAYNQQQKGSGSNVAQGLAQLGSSLVAGYLGMEQMRERKKQAELDMQMKLEDQQMQRETHQMRKTAFEQQQLAAQEKQRLAQLDAGISAFTENVESQVFETIGNVSAGEGLAVAKSHVKEFLASEQFSALSPEDRFYVSSRLQSFVTDLQKDNIDRLRGEGNALKDSKLQSAVNTFGMSASSLIQGLETEYVADGDVQSTINHVFTEANSLLNNPDYAAIARDPQLYFEYQAEIAKMVGSALNNRYKNTGSRLAEADRWMQASQDLADLEALANIGEISTYDYQRRGTQIMRQLGMNGSPNELPTAQVNLRQDMIKKEQLNIDLSEIQERQQFLNPMVNSPEYQAAQRFGVSQVVHDAVNGRGRGVEGTIAHYEAMKTASPRQFRAEQGGAIIDLLEGYRNDQKRIRALNQEAAKLEQELAKLDFKINPLPFKETMIPAGTPLGTLGGFSAEPEFRVIEAPDRLPQANAAEAEAVKAQLKQIDLERQDILFNYAQYGLNVQDPKDTQFLDRLADETAAARQWVEEQRKQTGGSSVQPSSYGSLSNQTSETLPKTQTRPVASSRITEEERAKLRQYRTGTVSEIPRNEAPSAPYLPLKGSLVKNEWGYTPFKGGKVTLTSDMGMRMHPVHGTRKMHTGIDIVSTDPRVATVQGGTVERVYSPKESGGYGNAIAVRTPDGRVEFFAHLDSVAVRPGDKLAPGHQIGVMGSTGVSTGAHLHFEVWKAGTDVDSFGKGLQEDPKAYMSMATLKLQQPSGQGNLPSGAPSVTMTGNEAVYNTGMLRLGGNLVYVRGRIFDKSTMRFRDVRPSDSELVSRGVPITKKLGGSQPMGSGYVGSGADAIRITEEGSRVSKAYKIPERARKQKTFLLVTPTGRYDSKGRTILALRGYKDNKQLFAVEAISGQSGADADRDIPGNMAMLPDGEYAVAKNPIPGDSPGVGKTFWATDPKFNTGRNGLGIHLDVGGDGTAGNLGIRLQADYAKVEDFLKRHPGLAMHVNTKDANEELAQASGVATMQGRPMNNYTGNLDIHKASYGKNNPNSNYGFEKLKQHSSWARALAQGADKVGVPAVWIADLIASESDWQPNIDNGVGYAGFIQFGDAAAKDVARELGYKDWKSWTRNRILRMGPEWQLHTAIPTYFKVQERYAGKKISTAEDLIAAVWGGARLLKQSAQERVRRNISDGWVDWYGKLKQVQDKSPGRSYRWTHTKNSTYHLNPRSGCKICNSMQHSGNFIPHKHDMNNFNYE